MKIVIKISLLIFVCHSIIVSQELFEAYNDEFLYLHPFINYSYNQEWQDEWETNQFSKNNLRLSYGSITTTALQSHTELRLNNLLGKGWRFRGSGIIDENRYNPIIAKELFLGLEKQLFQSVSLSLATNPAENKENMDLRFGIFFQKDNRTNYLNIEFALEDFMYSEKNPDGGKSKFQPFSVLWKLRHSVGKFCLISDGKISSGFEREYQNMELSPQISRSKHDDDFVKAKINYSFNEYSLISISFLYNHFYGEEYFRDSLKSDINDNDLNKISLEYYKYFSQKHRFRVKSAYVIHNIQASSFEYDRKDILLGLYYAYIHGNNIFEAGYLASIFDWKYDQKAPSLNYSKNSYSDKINISWAYTFQDIGIILLSISHEISLGGFGGANVQYQMIF